MAEEAITGKWLEELGFREQTHIVFHIGKFYIWDRKFFGVGSTCPGNRRQIAQVESRQHLLEILRALRVDFNDPDAKVLLHRISRQLPGKNTCPEGLVQCEKCTPSPEPEKFVAQWECVVTKQTGGDTVCCDAKLINGTGDDLEFWEIEVPGNKWVEGDVFYVLRSR